jgi:hypothetical protein
VLLAKLGAVLVPSPTSGLSLVSHLLDHIPRTIALKMNNIDINKLFTGKIGLPPSLLCLAFRMDKVNFPRQIGKRDASQVEYNGIIVAEYITPAMGLVAGLPFRNDLHVSALYLVPVF